MFDDGLCVHWIMHWNWFLNGNCTNNLYWYLTFNWNLHMHRVWTVDRHWHRDWTFNWDGDWVWNRNFDRVWTIDWHWDQTFNWNANGANNWSDAASIMMIVVSVLLIAIVLFSMMVMMMVVMWSTAGISREATDLNRLQCWGRGQFVVSVSVTMSMSVASIMLIFQSVRSILLTTVQSQDSTLGDL